MKNYYQEAVERSRSATEESPQQALRRVRDGSCYGALRFVIGLCVACGYVLAALAFFAAAVGPNLEATQRAMAAGAGAALFILTLASHQAMRLLVDIADMLVENVRHK